MQFVIDLLPSVAVGINEKHLLKLYSQFLAKLWAKPMAKHYHSSSTGNLRMKQPQTSRSRPDANGNGLRGAANHPPVLLRRKLRHSVNSLRLPIINNFKIPQYALRPLGDIGRRIIHSTDSGLGFSGGIFGPPLAYDVEVTQNYQSLTDPIRLSDISFPCKSFAVLHFCTICNDPSFLASFFNTRRSDHTDRIWTCP